MRRVVQREPPPYGLHGQQRWPETNKPTQPQRERRPTVMQPAIAASLRDADSGRGEIDPQPVGRARGLAR